MQAVSSSPSTARRAPARARSRARSPHNWAIAMSTAARCIGPSAGRRCGTASRSTTRRRSRGWRRRRSSTSVRTRVTIDGDDVTRAIRTPEIDRAAASVARLPRVRAVLVDQQREHGCGRRHRDGGTGHRHRRLPARRREDLPRRVGRRARPAARHRSRALGRTGGRRRGRDAPHRARSRSTGRGITSPLYAAPDAIVVDTTGKPIDAVVDEVLAVVKTRGLRGCGTRVSSLYFLSL